MNRPCLFKLSENSRKLKTAYLAYFLLKKYNKIKECDKYKIILVNRSL